MFKINHNVSRYCPQNIKSGYKFAFNGKENDSEGLGGGGSTYDYGFRIYNPQYGKFLSIDPLTMSYPWYTPYQFAGNKPIAAIDLDGLEEYYSYNGDLIGKFGNSTDIRIVKDINVIENVKLEYAKNHSKNTNFASTFLVEGGIQTIVETTNVLNRVNSPNPKDKSYESIGKYEHASAINDNGSITSSVADKPASLQTKINPETGKEEVYYVGEVKLESPSGTNVLIHGHPTAVVFDNNNMGFVIPIEPSDIDLEYFKKHPANQNIITGWIEKPNLSFEYKIDPVTSKSYKDYSSSSGTQGAKFYDTTGNEQFTLSEKSMKKIVKNHSKIK